MGKKDEKAKSSLKEHRGFTERVGQLCSEVTVADVASDVTAARKASQ